MHDHIARIQRYLLVIKEQYETIQSTLRHISPGNSDTEANVRAVAHQMLLTQVHNRMRMHDTLIAKMQAYVDACSTPTDTEAASGADVASADVAPPPISVDDEWMFLYEIDNAADGYVTDDDEYTADDDGDEVGDDDGDDDEVSDTLPLTSDQVYLKRLNQTRPLVLEPGLMSGQPAEDFAVELSTQEFRNLFGLDGSTLRRPMNVVEAFGVFGFVLSAEEQQRLLALDDKSQSSSAADADPGQSTSTVEPPSDTRDNDDPDYNIPGAA
jgi:hypothetical protein